MINTCKLREKDFIDPNLPCSSSAETTLTFGQALVKYPGFFLGNNDKYVSLTERPRNDSYEARCNKLSENKREKLKRHLDTKEEVTRSDPHFFQRMRKEGVLRHVA
jgi:hypothetical protein